MIGPIVNSGGLFIGGIIGVIFADIFPERLKKALPSIFGVITLCPVSYTHLTLPTN